MKIHIHLSVAIFDKMLLIILTSIFVFLIYFAFIKPHRYWKERGVKHERPWPLFGNLVSIIFQKQSLPEFFRETYNKHEGERYVAFYQFNLPSLMLRDPELIKQIGVKDFEAFPEHTMFAPEESDPLWAKNLFAMPGGEEWRDVRAVLSPAFTSSKLRTMFSLVVECAKQFADYVEKQGDFITLEMKDTFAKVTNDIIATTAFGVGCNSFEEPKNEIFVMGKEATAFDGFLISLKFFIAAINPALAKMLKIRFISEPVTEFFRRIVRETVKIREEKGIIRPDMINLLMEARKGRFHENGHSNGNGDKKHKIVITDDVMTAQAVVFFLAGFDTVSTAMSYTAYELALNPDIQERLQKEIDETWQKCNGNIVYDDLMGMKYLDMVISEALRKWPPFAVTDRKLIRNYTIQPKDLHDKPLHLDSKVVCQIPIYSLHRDPKYFPNPDKFDPERFNDENKQTIVPFTYLPFGTGPRNCIGSRFALLEVKIVIFYLMCKFEIVPVEKTAIPLVLSKSNVNPLPDEGFWLGLRLRNRI
ncbi:hypothetical protein ILUMI_11459 [Ignelater luminosus]|uniref:Cytochrome P450 n=1 Tax=Ignelater luminosus TaxID=2038154 RepID=A0A8K0CW67_IGNLU|nr:hypothetical protein ILUMI_11459 [Ignelater luminosus]